MQLGSRPARPFLIIGLAAAASLTSAPAFANQSATAAASAQAAIIDVHGLVNTHKLDFGTIIPGNTTGTVVIAPDGTRSRTGGAVLAGGTPAAAQFYAYSRRNTTATLWLGANTITLTRAGGGTMTVNTFTISSTPPSAISTTHTTFTLNTPNGIFPFSIGATLHVGVHQTPGTYTGTFTVNIQYN